LLQHNHAILADFGVAAALEHAALGERLTGTGSASARWATWPRKQLAGEPGVDARVDLYALGVLAYEMLAAGRRSAGRRPSACWRRT
jgi:serine/threonine-protein kinase